jgi:CBS domain-containing protein
MDTTFTTNADLSSSYLGSEGAPQSRPVAELANHTVVKLPSWFTVAAALRVARLKGCSHLLVTDRHRVVGTIATHLLATAPGADPLARWMTASELTLAATLSDQEAWRVMSLEGLDCVPVVSGAVLLGIVTRADLAAASARWEAAE